MNNVNIKILSDIQCRVYVDNELRAIAKPNLIEKVCVSRGEYYTNVHGGHFMRPLCTLI